MGAKVCLVLGILLLSHVLIPTEVEAREMLQEPQTAEEKKTDKDAQHVTNKPLCKSPYGCREGTRPGNPYNPPCKSTYHCREGTRPGPVVPIPKGKPYARPGVPHYSPRRPYNPPGRDRPYNPPGHARPHNPPGHARPYNPPGCKSKYNCREPPRP